MQSYSRDTGRGKSREGGGVGDVSYLDLAAEPRALLARIHPREDGALARLEDVACRDRE